MPYRWKLPLLYVLSTDARRSHSSLPRGDPVRELAGEVLQRDPLLELFSNVRWTDRSAISLTRSNKADVFVLCDEGARWKGGNACDEGARWKGGNAWSRIACRRGEAVGEGRAE